MLEAQDSGSRLECPTCGRRYAVEQGVACFLDQRDPFYEGRYLNTARYIPRREVAPWSWPLWLMNSGYVWAVRQNVPAGATVLEMGCASGIAYFAHRYRMVGLDLSFSSLAAVADIYGACLQADVTRSIPLPDASVDAIVSSFVWEHLTPEDKPKALAEFRRVLRKGGRLVFLYDVESNGPLYRRMRRKDPALYREILIEREGHLGWQSPAQNRDIFAQHGFDVLSERGKDKLAISPPMYDKVQHWGGWFERLARVGLAFRRGLPYHVYNGVNRVVDETVGRLLPIDWSRVVVTVCARRDDVDRGRQPGTSSRAEAGPSSR